MTPAQPDLCPPCADLGTCGPVCPGDDYEDEYGPDCSYPGFDYAPGLEDGPDESPKYAVPLF